jgi:hypothetical protein
MKITKQQYNDLQETIKLARAETKTYNFKMNNILNLALDVTQEDGSTDFTFDTIFNDTWTVDELLKKLNIEAEKK